MPRIPAKRQTVIPASTPLPELKAYDRLTVITNIHHEHRGESPRTIPVGYSRSLLEKEEPYQRRFNAKPEWAPVDLGWFDPAKVGCIVIENLEGKSALVNPTEEERAEIDAKVLEVSYSKNSSECDLIPPRAADIKWPADATKLHIRCQSGTASCRISILSR